MESQVYLHLHQEMPPPVGRPQHRPQHPQLHQNPRIEGGEQELGAILKIHPFSHSGNFRRGAKRRQTVIPKE